MVRYYFKPSSIVSYSPGIFGGINALEGPDAARLDAAFSIPNLPNFSNIKIEFLSLR